MRITSSSVDKYDYGWMAAPWEGGDSAAPTPSGDRWYGGFIPNWWPRKGGTGYYGPPSSVWYRTILFVLILSALLKGG